MRIIVYSAELLFGEALTSLLVKSGYQVVGCCDNSSEFIDLIQTLEVDACLIDITTEADVSTVQLVKNFALSLPIVILDIEANSPLIQLAIDAGADAVCLKVDGIEEIERVLKRAMDHHRTARPILSASARMRVQNRPSNLDSLNLTPKERDVLGLLIRGTSTSDIAVDLGVSEATIRTHVQHLFNKFGVHSRIALVATAIRSGIATSVKDREVVSAD